ncbi:MAG: hypothetical protein KGJ97_12860, partial [Xanthomonadaceae bacterium]|nr:hypothetical protein [Xanthomonadaceae bacterium]
MSAHDKSAGVPKKAAGRTSPLLTPGLGSGQVAFVGEAVEQDLSVTVLCWPTIPVAWSMLSEAASAMRSVREGLSMSGPAEGSSWLQQAAPQLSRPLEREFGAAESTLASLVGRLPVCFAVAIEEHQADVRQASAALTSRALFSGCLAGYDNFLKSSSQQAFRVMVVPDRGEARNEQHLAVYNELLPHLDGARRLRAIELAFWPEARLPLPMEVAQLAAAAVLRHLQDPAQSNPLFDVIRDHLAPPSRFHAGTTLKS